MKATRQEVYSAINDERVFQDRKWGTVEEHPHEVGSWLTIMRRLLSDAEHAWMSERGDEGAIDELRAVAEARSPVHEGAPEPREWR